MRESPRPSARTGRKRVVPHRRPTETAADAEAPVDFFKKKKKKKMKARHQSNNNNNSNKITAQTFFFKSKITS